MIEICETVYDCFMEEMYPLLQHLSRSKQDVQQAQKMLKDLNLSNENEVEVVSAGIRSDETFFNEDYDSASDLETPLPLTVAVDKQTLYVKLECIGAEVGRRIAERLVSDRTQRLPELLDIMKFICKEFWLFVYKKQIDNLKTNHKGVFVLQDNEFKPLSYAASLNLASEQYPMAYPCGLMRGALSQLGVECHVQAEQQGQAVTFKLEVI